MRSIFFTTPEVNSERWLTAFPEAVVLSNTSLDLVEDESSIDVDCIVWLLLDQYWQKQCAGILQRGARLVAMTLNEDADQAREVIGAGASAYIHAFSATDMLKQVHQVVVNEGLWLSPHILKTLMTSGETKEQSNPRTVVLTTRERAVALLVAQGKSNKEVARELDITERTVKAHLSACFSKLDVRDRAQLTLLINR